MRPVNEIEKWLQVNFIIINKKDLKQTEHVDTQRMWILKRRGFVCPKYYKY